MRSCKRLVGINEIFNQIATKTISGAGSAGNGRLFTKSEIITLSFVLAYHILGAMPASAPAFMQAKWRVGRVPRRHS